jgi:hypothetical protein
MRGRSRRRLVALLRLVILLRLITVLRLGILLRLIIVLRWITLGRLVSLGRLVAESELPETTLSERREFGNRMHRVGPAALRTHRSYLAISHRIIVLLRPLRGKDLGQECYPARSRRAASVSAFSLPKATSRGRYFMPQSGASTRRSAGT